MDTDENKLFAKYLHEHRTVFFVFGIIFIIAGLFIPHKLVRPVVSSSQQTVNVIKEIHPVGGPITKVTIKITIQFPEEMSVSDSKMVQVKWTTDQWDAWKPTLSQPDSLAVKRIPDSQIPLRLGLYGANMVIKPQEMLTSTYAMRDAVCTWSWVISPQKAGDQQLLLEVSELGILNGEYTVQFNNQKEQTRNDHPLQVIPLSIKVLTDEGISLRMFLYIKYITIVFGAVMLYPTISALITKTVMPTKQSAMTERRLPPD